MEQRVAADQRVGGVEEDGRRTARGGRRGGRLRSARARGRPAQRAGRKRADLPASRHRWMDNVLGCMLVWPLDV